ncbi:MAG: alpha/beta hydrolase family protein [Myxococcota bacterium]
MKCLISVVLLHMFLFSGCGSDPDTSADASGDVLAPADASAEGDGLGSEAETSDDVVMAQDDAGDVGDQGAVQDETRVDLGWDVSVDGPYQAGHRTLEVTYPSVSLGADRTIEYHLWYPTEATEGETVYYAEIFVDENVFGEAPLAPPAVGDHYPLHIHSHGNLGYAGSSPHLMRHFATHGWVVVAPSHKGNTIIDNLSPRPAWMYTVRSEDVSATLDALAVLPEADALAGKVDVSAALLSGHSYGAYTALGLAGAAFNMEQIPSVCAEDESGECSDAVLGLFEAGVRDERLIASIPMAPGSYDMYAEGISDIVIPTMHMTGSEDRPQANADVWAALPAPAHRVHVEGGCHQLFALGGCELIPDDPGLVIVNAYALAFGRHYLLEDQSVLSLLDGTEVLDETVTLSTK